MKTNKLLFSTIAGFIGCIAMFLFAINISTAQAIAPDLAVDNIVVTPSSPEVSEAVVIVVTVTNTGDENITNASGTNSYLYSFEDFVASSSDPTADPVPSESNPLEPGEITTYTWEGSFSVDGIKALSFTIDSDDNLVEGDESNNIGSSTVVVVASDETAPVISDITVSNITDSGATITWLTNEFATTHIAYGLSDSYTDELSDSALVTSHTVLIGGLSADTMYHYMVSSQDEAENLSSSTDLTFTTSASNSDDDSDDNNGDDSDDSDDDSDDNNGDENLLVCHYNRGSKEYVAIRVSESGWKHGHKHHYKDYLSRTGSCDGQPSDDDDSDDDSDESDNPLVQRLRERIRSLQYRISQFEEEVIERERQLLRRVNRALTERLHGRVLLQVENNGEAWYVDEDTDQRFYLRDGEAAFQALRAFGLGISDEDLEKIPIGLNERFSFEDSDEDGLPDKLEESIGTDPNDADSDDDGFEDGEELKNNYRPDSNERYQYDQALINRLRGKILLQVKKNGQAWYLNPEDGKRYYLKDRESAYNIMRYLSLGITNDDIREIDVGSLASEE